MEITATINERIDTLNARLDEVEKDLPAVPKAALRLNRAVTERVFDGTGRVGTVVVETLEDLTEAATSTYKSIAKNAGVDVDRFVDAATKFAEDSYEFASSGFKTVAGQFGVAVDKAEEAAVKTNASVAKTVNKTAQRVEDSETKAEKKALVKKTKAELYEMAKDLDVDGRATMSKGELVNAIAKEI
jgi:cell division septum initiation protein DivIVA